MRTKWSLVNLGELDGLETQVIYHAVALAVSEGVRRNTVLINWPDRPFVCIGFHQTVDLEIDVDYCRTNGIPFYRRACGGGTVLLDRDQIFYQVVTHIDTPGIARKADKFYEQLLAPVVKTYQDLGVNAQFRPVNDIVVGGRKISGNGAATFESAMELVGNFILEFPRKLMAQILKVPNEKFRDKVIKSLEAGVTSLKDELGSIPSRKEIIEIYTRNFEALLGIDFEWGELDERTLEIMDNLKHKYQTEEWLFQVTRRNPRLVKSLKISGSLQVIQSLYKAPGGLIRLLMEIDHETIKDKLITGDFWMLPERSVNSLEKTLRGTKIELTKLQKVITQFYEQNKIQAPGTTPEDFVKTIIQGVNQ
ncbi:MAG: lipoate--protein ligase [Candidatus Heimdallarchaeota archaeon]